MKWFALIILFVGVFSTTSFAQTNEACTQILTNLDSQIAENAKACPSNPEDAPRIQTHKIYQAACQTDLPKTAAKDCSTGSDAQTSCTLNSQAAQQVIGQGDVSLMSKAFVAQGTQSEQCLMSAYTICQHSVTDGEKSCAMWSNRVQDQAEFCDQDLTNATLTARQQLASCDDAAARAQIQDRFNKIENTIQTYRKYSQAETSSNENAKKQANGFEKSYGTNVNTQLRSIASQKTSGNALEYQVGVAPESN